MHITKSIVHLTRKSTHIHYIHTLIMRAFPVMYTSMVRGERGGFVISCSLNMPNGDVINYGKLQEKIIQFSAFKENKNIDIGIQK